MGYIELDKINPAYFVGSCFSELSWRYLNQMRSGWKMDSS